MKLSEITLQNIIDIINKNEDTLIIERDQQYVIVAEILGGYLEKHCIPLIEYINNYDNIDFLLSKVHGVSLIQYLSWKEAMISGVKCCALTRLNRPCQNYVMSSRYKVPKNPKDWVPNMERYCPTHDNNTMNIRK